MAKKKITQADRDATWSCIIGTTDLADLAECDLVIEAIFEDLQAKGDLFKELDNICHENTIFTSNTSSLSLAEMAESSIPVINLTGRNPGIQNSITLTTISTSFHSFRPVNGLIDSITLFLITGNYYFVYSYNYWLHFYNGKISANIFYSCSFLFQ